MQLDAAGAKAAFDALRRDYPDRYEWRHTGVGFANGGRALTTGVDDDVDASLLSTLNVLGFNVDES